MQYAIYNMKYIICTIYTRDIYLRIGNGRRPLGVCRAQSLALVRQCARTSCTLFIDMSDFIHGRVQFARQSRVCVALILELGLVCE